MKTILQFRKLFIIPLLFLMVGNVCLGQKILPNFTDYDQVGQSWSSLPLGNNAPGTIYTINDWGCYMVSATMLIKYSGIDVTPVEVNNWLATKKWANSFSQSRVTQYPTSVFQTDGTSSNFDAVRLKRSIDNGNPIIVQVTNHFMVIKGYNNSGTQMSDFIVSNPALSASKDIYDLSYYNANRTEPLKTYTNIIGYHFYKNFPNVLTFNQNLAIYGGSVINPKPFYLYFKEADLGNYNFSKTMISNMKIEGMGNNIVPNSRIIDHEYINVDGIGWRKIKMQFQIADLALINNAHESRTISFDLTVGGVKKTYQNDQLYFADYKNTSSTFTDINDLNNWVETYVRKGADLGLFKGTSLQTFNPSGTLQKQHAAKIIVEAGVRLGLLNIDTGTSGGTFSDVNQFSEFFKHIQTLRNYGYITAGTSFNPSNAITIGQLCKLLVNVFKISDSDTAPTNFINLSKRKIVPINSDATLIPYMAKVLRLVDIRENTPGFFFTENLWDFLDFSSVNTVLTGQIQVDGSNSISRGIMAKLITNIMIWKAKKKNLALFRTTGKADISQNIDEYISYGEKYDNASITATSTPVTTNQQTYSCASGGSVTILYNPGSLPQHYYWSMLKNGATLTSNNEQHSSVTFTAPTVATPTQWKIYTYTANNRGKARENFITIVVGGSSGGANAAPTNQAHSLSLYGATSSSLTASWTRGNGQNCIVTCKEVGANAQDVPDSGVIYAGNTNYPSAPAIFNGSDTKVVYTGTNSSCIITGLNPNTQYQIAVFEYNGTTPLTVQYNLSNAPIATRSTLQLVNTTPSANFTWDESLTHQTGQSFVFTNTSTNANTFKWSILPSGTISNTTSSSTTNVTFTNSGQHTLTLIATNTSTGETSTRTHNFYVYNATELMADLQPTNLNFTSPIVGGQNLTITCNVQNNSTASQSYTTHITFVLSADQIIDVSDHFLGQQEYTIGAGESVSITHNATNIYNTFSGNYYILAKADYWNNVPNGYVPESNETNNIISKAINLIAALPDFVALSITPSVSIVASGQQFSVSGTFRNIGLGNAQANNVIADFYISNDNTLSNDDIKINGAIFVDNNSSILYGNSPIVNGTTNVRIPFEVSNGNYYLFCAIDYTRSQTPRLEFNFNLESNENNNYISVPITVSNPFQPTVNASNLTISNVTANSMRISWTRGNGAGCIVLARSNSDLPNKIIDGVSYIGNPNFSLASGIRGYYSSASGEVFIDNYSYVKLIYDGTGSSVDVSGLDSNETYSFIVLEYNGSSASKDYFQVSNFKCISAHTLEQNSLNPFKRLYGTVAPGTNNSVYHPSTIKFFNEKNGVIFRNYNGLGLTSDGGLSWSFIKNSLIEKNSESSVKSSSWLENGSGWLVFENGSILKTIDFGKSWTEKKLDRSIEDVCFVNQNIGFVALKSLINVSGNDGAIYKTTDGGSIWSSVGTFPRIISSIFFLNENLGWATSYTTSSSFDKIFYKTTNGGSTWDQVIFSTNPSQSSVLTDIYFTDENNGFAMTVFGWLLKTSNGGASWSMNNIFNISTTINSYSKIDFVNSKIGFINLQNKKLAKTTDGGLSWSISVIQNDFTKDSEGSTAEIDAISENIVYVGGISGLLKSTTGGSSNSIEINTLSQTAYCSTQSINLPYNISGVYNTSNIFNVELSDGLGAFTTPLNLKSFTGAGTSSVNISLPQNITVGSGYKLRIVGTSPSIVSNVSNAFAVSLAPASSVSITPTTSTICPSQSVTFTATSTNGGTSPTYTWKKNGAVVDGNTATYTDNKLNNGDVVWVEMVSNQTCGSTTPVVAAPTTINVTPIEAPFIQAIADILAASTDVGVQWIRNGQPITGATSQFYEATQTGFYRFSVTIGGCTVLSDIYQLISLGTQTNNFENNSLQVYPNPFNELLNIEVKEVNLQTFQIIDLQGRLITQEKISGNSHQINLNRLPQAVYILEVVTDKAKQRVKIVKK